MNRMDMILKGPGLDLARRARFDPRGDAARRHPDTRRIGRRFQRTVGPTQLQRVDGQRTLTLSVYPTHPRMTVQEALDRLRDVAGPQIRELLPADVGLQYRGTADRLEQAFSTMGWNLVTAAIVLFLILAAMFRSVSRMQPS